jgi:hypothetical protein
MAPDSVRRPAYTPLTPGAIRDRIASFRAFQQPVASGGLGWPSGGYNSGGYSYNYGYGFGYGGFGFGGFGWGPLFFGSGFFCDPLGLWICYSPAGYFPGSSFYLFPTMAYMAPFGPFPYSFSYYPGSLFYNSPISPVYFGGYCPLCSSTVYNPFAFGLNTGNSYLTPLESSVLISNGVMPGLQSASSMGAAISGNDSEATSDSSAAGETAADADAGPSRSVTVFASQNPRPGEPLTLIFSNGTTVQATEYWLGNDGQVHYVTSAGAKYAVPLDQLDLTGTVDANSQKGVQFLLPPSPQPQPSSPAQPPAPPQAH